MLNHLNQLADYNLVSPLMISIIDDDNYKIEKYSKLILKENYSDMGYFVATCCIPLVFDEAKLNGLVDQSVGY